MQGIYLDELGYGFVKKCLELYWGSIPFLGLAIAIIFYMFLNKNDDNRFIKVYVTFLTFTIYNPVLIKIFWGFLNEDGTYYRMFWLLPVSLILAYGSTLFISKIKNGKKAIVYFVAFLWIITLVGAPQMKINELLNVPTNTLMVDENIIQISEIIHNDSNNTEVRIAAAPEVSRTIRQYDASFLITTDSDNILAWQGIPDRQYLIENESYRYKKAIMDTLYSGDCSNTDLFIQSLGLTGTEYLIYNKVLDIGGYFDDLGYRMVGSTDNYNIYSCK